MGTQRVAAFFTGTKSTHLKLFSASETSFGATAVYLCRLGRSLAVFEPEKWFISLEMPFLSVTMDNQRHKIDAYFHITELQALRSVLPFDVLFAGDTTFTEKQLQRGQVAGICVDKPAAHRTLDAIRRYCRQRPTIYLPTHDSLAAERLKNRQFTHIVPW